MKITNRRNRVAAWMLVVAAAFTVSASAQTRRVGGGSASFSGFAFYWETQLNPPTPPLATTFGTAHDETAPGQVHRMLIDRAKRVYFGYTVRIEPLAGNTFRLAFQPLSLTASLREHLGPDAASWTSLPAPRFPGPQTIRGGEVLELPLLANDAWGQRLTEYVTVQDPEQRAVGFRALTESSREFSFEAGRPRDFSVTDATLRVQDPRMFINGRFEESSSRSVGEETGAVVWIYIPNRGRFLLSLVPHASQGFRRAGEIRGSSLRFSIGADSYSVSSADRIASGSSAYNLYVLHQPGWRPNYPHANVDVMTIGSADRVQDALAK